jgi:hypothetical protein
MVNEVSGAAFAGTVSPKAASSTRRSSSLAEGLVETELASASQSSGQS